MRYFRLAGHQKELITQRAVEGISGWCGSERMASTHRSVSASIILSCGVGRGN